MMTKAKKTTAVSLCAALALTSAIGGAIGFMPASAEDEPTAPAAVADREWTAYSGSPTATYDQTNGYTNFNGMESYGYRMYYNYKVRLDGLTVYLESDDMQDRSIFGFCLAKEQGDYGPDATKGYWAYNATVWPGSTVVGQTRLTSSITHNPNAGYMIGYTTAADAVASTANTIGGCDDAVSTFYSSAVWQNTSGEFGVKLTFTLVEAAGDVTDDCWCVTIEPTRGEKFSQQPASVNLYVNKRYMDCVLDENGDCYIVSYGWADSTSNLVPVYEMKLEDDNSRAYEEAELAAAQTAADAYEAAVRAVTDAETYQASIAARASLTEAISALRGNDQTVYETKLAAIDALYTSDETIQANVRAAVQESFTAAETAVAVLENEQDIGDETIQAAKDAVSAAEGAYNDMKNMLTAENQEYFTGLVETYEYAIDLASAKNWVISYETQAAALETSDDVLADIVEIKAFRAEYTGSDAETLITTVLTDEDKTALEARIAAADAKVAEIEAANSDEVKESYLVAFETALEMDMTIKFSIDDAKAAYLDLMDKVTIGEDDGELYTRLTAAYAELKAACEAYETAEIEAVSALLGEKYTLLSEFRPVRDRYNAIDLDYLMEENAEIEAAYAELTEAIGQNAFYYVEAYTPASTPTYEEVTRNKTGLLLDTEPIFPSRLNYNKMLDLTQGTEVVVELTEAAYYNDGSSANNLCFNFLLEPGWYKSHVDGISIIIWLYPTESNVQIFNNNDSVIASQSIATPIDGSNITIKVEYSDYYDFVQDTTYKAYQISVNEASFALTEEQLTSTGYEIGTDVYFSMGSFADSHDYNNLLTLVSVDDVTFAEEEEIPAVSGVTVSATSTTMTVGGSVTLNAAVDPAAAQPASVAWYVNGEQVSGSGLSYTLSPEAAGTYEVYCVVDGVTSNTVTVTANAGGDEDPGGSETPEEPEEGCAGCGTIGFGGWGGGIGLGILAGAAVLAMALGRKRKTDR